MHISTRRDKGQQNATRKYAVCLITSRAFTCNTSMLSGPDCSSIASCSLSAPAFSAGRSCCISAIASLRTAGQVEPMHCGTNLVCAARGRAAAGRRADRQAVLWHRQGEAHVRYNAATLNMLQDRLMLSRASAESVHVCSVGLSLRALELVATSTRASPTAPSRCEMARFSWAPRLLSAKSCQCLRCRAAESAMAVCVRSSPAPASPQWPLRTC